MHLKKIISLLLTLVLSVPFTSLVVWRKRLP
jgi:hypothetical protein